MKSNDRFRQWGLALSMATTIALQGCDQAGTGAATEAAAPAAANQQSGRAFTPITVEHELGTTVITQRPLRTVALDMNDVDFLDQLDVPVAGMPKDFVPHFLASYKDAPEVRDLGAIVQPNLEQVYAASPDLILITPLQARHYEELSEIAPTVHFDVNYRNSQVNHIEVIKDHLITLGRIFGKEDVAQARAAELDTRVAEAQRVTQGRPEKALVVLHNNGAFSSFGVQSRYGFIFNALGVKPASPIAEAGLHGQPISSEFIQQANPDIIYVVDRTAVMERRPTMDAASMGNPLLRQTNAWENNRVIFVDAEAWYVTAASVNSLKIVIDDVLRGYQG